mgnify:CR=1 FL=1
MSYASFCSPPNLALILKVFDFDEPLSLNTAIQLLKTLKDFNAILS